MKKELIICLIVIILVIFGNTVTQKYTKQCISQIEDNLDKLKVELMKEEKNEEEIENKTSEVREKWDNMQKNLAYYIEHTELEKIETQLFLLTGETKVKLYQDAVPEIEKCISILEHIQDKTSLSIKNIF